MTARVFLPLVLALGLVLGLALWVRAPDSAAREVAGAVERPAEAEILARLGRMEAALAQLTGAGLSAAPAPSAPPGLGAPSPREERRTEGPVLPVLTAADLAPLEEQMAALARAVEALQQVVGSGKTTSFPSLELLRGAGEPNRGQLDVLAELFRSEPGEAQNRVSG
jgi:hypothetical protein